jgi:prophage antirepressor-like protein
MTKEIVKAKTVINETLGKSVDVVTFKGAVWFFGRDVAKALGYRGSRLDSCIRKYCKESVMVRSGRDFAIEPIKLQNRWFIHLKGVIELAKHSPEDPTPVLDWINSLALTESGDQRLPLLSRETFIDWMLLLGKFLKGRELGTFDPETWYRALSDINDSDFEKAAMWHLYNSEFRPTPAEIRATVTRFSEPVKEDIDKVTVLRFSEPEEEQSVESVAPAVPSETDLIESDSPVKENTPEHPVGNSTESHGTPVLRAFQHTQFGQIRTHIKDDGEPWFVAKDVADILGYSDTEAMTRRLDSDEKMTYKLSGISKTNPVATLISESGFYNAVIGSNKPEAKAFRKWVTSEVLPSIRKTGKYSISDRNINNPKQKEVPYWYQSLDKMHPEAFAELEGITAGYIHRLAQIAEETVYSMSFLNDYFLRQMGVKDIMHIQTVPLQDKADYILEELSEWALRRMKNARLICDILEKAKKDNNGLSSEEIFRATNYAVSLRDCYSILNLLCSKGYATYRNEKSGKRVKIRKYFLSKHISTDYFEDDILFKEF